MLKVRVIFCRGNGLSWIVLLFNHFFSSWALSSGVHRQPINTRGVVDPKRYVAVKWNTRHALVNYPTVPRVGTYVCMYVYIRYVACSSQFQDESRDIRASGRTHPTPSNPQLTNNKNPPTPRSPERFHPMSRAHGLLLHPFALSRLPGRASV